jgi:hypothetical protein
MDQDMAFKSRGWGAALCAAYPLLILTPLFVFAAASPFADHSRTVEVGVDCAVVAFTIIAMQFVLSARLSWIEAPFGWDVVIRFRQAMAFVALCLACARHAKGFSIANEKKLSGIIPARFWLSMSRALNPSPIPEDHHAAAKQNVSSLCVAGRGIARGSCGGLPR